ncbi:hypothetical protein ABPG72_000902 [Tetrahymena utriculariae]
MDDGEDYGLHLALQNKKSKFRVEIRQRHQHAILQSNRTRLLQNRGQYNQQQQQSQIKQQINDNQENRSVLQDMLISIGQLNQLQKEQLGKLFDSLIDYILEQMCLDQNKIQEFQSIFSEEAKSIFLLNLLLSNQNELEYTLKQIILLGNCLCFSEEMCSVFMKNNYMQKLMDIMQAYSNEPKIIDKCLHCLYNIFSQDDFRDQIIAQYPIISYIENQYQNVFQLPPLQKEDQFIIALLCTTEKLFLNPPHIKCKKLNKIIQYLHTMIINAFKFNDPEYIYNQIISIILQYLENNNDRNIQYFLQNNNKLIHFLVNSISEQKKTLKQSISNMSTQSQMPKQISQDSKLDDENKSLINILNIFINITALDSKYDINGLLYNLYKSTRLVQILGSILSPNQKQQRINKINSYTATILSNIALGDLKTQQLILRDKKILKKVNNILDEQAWDEVQMEIVNIPINLACLSTEESVGLVIENGLFEQITKIIKSYFNLNSKTLKYALLGIENILESSEEKLKKKQNNINQQALFLVQQGFKQCFEELFNHENWYDDYQDVHEARGSHRTFFKAHVGHTSQDKRDQFKNYPEYILSVQASLQGLAVFGVSLIQYTKMDEEFFQFLIFQFSYQQEYLLFTLKQLLDRCFKEALLSVLKLQANRKWKGLGMFGILLTLNMSTYYNLILAYSVYYLWESFKFPLPWRIDDIYTSSEPWNTEYFYKNVLRSSTGLETIGSIVWPLFFCYILSQFVVYLCICRGVTVSGKVSVITASSPYILLFILMIRGLFLDGAMKGLSYLFSPDWSKLYESQVWVDAANQVIFQVSTGCGVLIVFGSYRPMNQEIIKTSYYIPIITVCCGLLASVVIFTFMGYMSNITNIDINDMPLKGPDLAFIVFPAVLTQMPFSNILSIVFFLVMIFLGIDTQFGQIDALATTIEDEFHGKNIEYRGFSIKMNYIRAGVCIIVSLSAFLFCSQAGFFYLDFVDNYSVSINMFVCIITEIYFYFYIQNWEEIEENIKLNIGEQTPAYMIFLMQYITPLICFILSIIAIYFQILDIFNQKWWISILGWAITLYPYYSIYYYYSKYKNTNATPKSNPTNCTELNVLNNSLNELQS